jgi:hypothetical protein
MTSGRDRFTFDSSARIRELTARNASESRASFEAEAGLRPAILDVITAKSSSRFATLAWLSGDVRIASFMFTTWTRMRSSDMASALASFLNSSMRISRNLRSAISSSARVKHACEFMGRTVIDFPEVRQQVMPHMKGDGRLHLRRRHLTPYFFASSLPPATVWVCCASIHLRMRRASAVRVSFPNELSNTRLTARSPIMACITRHSPASLVKPVF